MEYIGLEFRGLFTANRTTTSMNKFSTNRRSLEVSPVSLENKLAGSI
ncbi:MAG: hypothetical protein LBI70_01145 [Rickettsiales bacterium]|nr:hypothetical protein [Rickettsiales bacterium]